MVNGGISRHRRLYDLHYDTQTLDQEPILLLLYECCAHPYMFIVLQEASPDYGDHPSHSASSPLLSGLTFLCLDLFGI